jgi:hypothetical protein
MKGSIFPTFAMQCFHAGNPASPHGRTTLMYTDYDECVNPHLSDQGNQGTAFYPVRDLIMAALIAFRPA